jgi:hypothetical protein
MTKKNFLVLVLLVFIAWGIFAQEKSGAKNWIAGQVSLLGVGAQYERILTPQFSVGATVYFNSLFLFWNNFGVAVIGRYYPPLEVIELFTELGVGYGYKTGITGDITEWSGLLVEPAVGIKFDLGEPGKFFIEPRIAVPIVIGLERKLSANKEGFGIGATFRATFAMGYAF